MAKPETNKRQRHHLDRRADRIADQGESKGNANDLLTAAEVAEMLEITEQWVNQCRIKNHGPRFIETPSKATVIRYRRGDVIKWLRERARAAKEYA